MKRSTLIVVAAMALAFNAPAFAQQRSHPGGGPPAGHATGNSSTTSGPHDAGATVHTDMSHASPSDVLSHNTAIAGKIKALTNEDASMACSNFKQEPRPVRCSRARGKEPEHSRRLRRAQGENNRHPRHEPGQGHRIARAQRQRQVRNQEGQQTSLG